MVDQPAPPTPVVTFVYADWVTAFPMFALVTQPFALSYFNRAALIFGNSSCNPAYRDGNMTLLMYLLTAHIAWLTSYRDAQGNISSGGTVAPPGIVGRISSASEGSVSVGTEWSGSGAPTESWYLQTPWGAEFWAATAQYRTFRYAAQRTYVPSAIFPMRRPWGQ